MFSSLNFNGFLNLLYIVFMAGCFLNVYDFELQVGWTNFCLTVSPDLFFSFTILGDFFFKLQWVSKFLFLRSLPFLKDFHGRTFLAFLNVNISAGFKLV